MKYLDVSHKLAEFGKELLNKKSLESGLPLIAKYAKETIGADRCSIFIYDKEANNLWTTLADGVEKIVIPADEGIVGYTIKQKKPVIINDPYTHPKFLKDIDKKTGYKTNNILTAPIFNPSNEISGVIELLNKTGGFDNEDIHFITFFAHFISGFIEMLKLFKNKKEANK